MRVFDMAPSRAKPYRVTLDDAERNRKFPPFAMQGIALKASGPRSSLAELPCFGARFACNSGRSRDSCAK
jgi:hypothetical protein